MSHRIEAFGRARGMRLSLLASLGLLPIACGGSVVNDQGGRAGPGTEAQAGQGGSAGASPMTVELGADPMAGDTRPAAGGAAPTTGGAAPTAGGAAPTAGGAAPAAGLGGATPTYPGPTGIGDGVPTCDAPTIDPITKLVQCANGYSHRSEPTLCPLAVGATGTAGAGGASDVPASLECNSDSDCSAFPLGYCYPQVPFASSCRSGCQQDSDCGSQELCLCDGSAHGGVCVSTSCTTDSDCGPGGRCAEQIQPCGPPTFICQKPSDHCGSFCEACLGGFESKICATCGRPFLVLDRARVAPVAANADWLEAALPAPNLQGLSPAARAELAAHWARLGQMEHASIAAFARFSLQLLSLAAPAELVEACTRALADETTHAKLCFAMASHYAGSALGPSRLDVSECLNASSLTEIMTLVFREGALGETCAALEAHACADAARDPALERLYARIAVDEQRHAELAFRFLAWALTRATGAQRQEFEHAVERGLHEAETRYGWESQAGGDEHGILSSSTLLAIRRSAAREVVRPLSAALRSAAPRSTPLCDGSPAVAVA